jgi:quinol monooxygenase YgiN
MLTLTLIPDRRRTDVVAKALRQVMTETAGAPGCLRCALSADLATPGALHYVEEWTGEAPLRRHMRSGRFKQLLQVMEQAIVEPQFAVRVVSQSGGLEYVQDAMGEEAR